MRLDNDDIDGMLNAVRDNFLGNSKIELIDMIMELKYGDKAEDVDIIADYISYVGELK